MEIKDEHKKYVYGGLAIAALGVVGAGYYCSKGSDANSELKRKRKSLMKLKYTNTFDEHPKVMWACDDEYVGLYVAGDKKNQEAGLKVGSMLVKIGSQRVAGDDMESITLKLRRLKDFPVTLQFFEQAHLEEKWNAAMDHRETGKQFYMEKDFESALKEYDAAIELHPTLKLLYSNKVLCLLNLGRPEEALDACSTMLRLDHRFVKGHFLKGKVFLALADSLEDDLHKQIRVSHAIAEFRTTLKRQPENTNAEALLKQALTMNDEIKERIDAKIKEELAEQRRKQEEWLEKMKQAAEEQKKLEEAQKAAENPEIVELEATETTTETTDAKSDTASDAPVLIEQSEADPDLKLSESIVIVEKESVAKTSEKEEDLQSKEVEEIDDQAIVETADTEVSASEPVKVDEPVQVPVKVDEPVKFDEPVKAQEQEKVEPAQKSQADVAQDVEPVQKSEPVQVVQEAGEKVEVQESSAKETEVTPVKDVQESQKEEELESKDAQISEPPQQLEQNQSPASTNGDYVMVTPRTGEPAQKEEAKAVESKAPEKVEGQKTKTIEGDISDIHDGELN